MIIGIQYQVIDNVTDLHILRDRKSFNYTFNDDLLCLLQKNFCSPNSLYIFAKDSGGNFAGFCSMDSDWWEDNYFFIREILIDDVFRGNNIGTELFSRCIVFAKEKGAHGIVTETDSENIVMQKLCKKFYFEKYKNPHWNEGFTYKLKF